MICLVTNHYICANESRRSACVSLCFQFVLSVLLSEFGSEVCSLTMSWSALSCDLFVLKLWNTTLNRISVSNMNSVACKSPRDRFLHPREVLFYIHSGRSQWWPYFYMLSCSLLEFVSHDCFHPVWPQVPSCTVQYAGIFHLETRMRK